jgi:acyl carrier protein
MLMGTGCLSLVGASDPSTRDGVASPGGYTMDKREICNKIKEAIAKISDIDVADIADTASFQDDLGLDSLVLLEISVDIEMQFGLEVHEDDLKQLQTVQDAVEFVQQALIGQA